MDDEGVLDPRVAEWLEANPMMATPFEDFSPEMLALARGPVGAPASLGSGFDATGRALGDQD